MKKDVMVVTGAGQIGMAIARRVGFGKKIILGDKSMENAQTIAKILNEAGYDVEPFEMDLSSRESILSIISKAQEYGEIKYLVNAAGVSPSQAPIEAILKVDLYGTAVLLEEVGKVIAEGGAGDEPAKQQESVIENPVKEDAEEDSQKPSEETTDEQLANETASRSDTLVVYFSRTGEQYEVGVIDKGNTAIVADMIVEKTGADAFEILPEDDHYPYTYDELTDVAKKEQDENARPANAGEVPDLSGYNTIFIGAPVWWGDWPMIMYTFFENNADALAGKTLIPFSTHAGSGLSGFDSKLSSACPNSTVGEGLAIAGTDAQNDQDSVKNTVNEWLSGLGY